MRGWTGRARRAAGTLAAATVLVLGASACGSEESPAEAAPEISARLDRVDAAIEAENYGRARDAVRALVAETEAARDDGAISDDQAERIMEAAASLLARLPEDGSDELPNPEDELPPDLVEPDPDTEETEQPPADQGENDGGNGEEEGGGNDGGDVDEGNGPNDKKDKDKKDEKEGKSNGGNG